MLKEIFCEFMGVGGFKRSPEGAYSWQHLTFVSALMFLMVLLAFLLGKKNRYASQKKKNSVISISAILIVFVELTKIVFNCWEAGSISNIRSNLPLFLCSIQLIAIPLAAATKGRLKEAALDFVFVFGLLGAVLGTFGAAQNYGTYPVLSFINVNSGITHSISGFCSLYIVISGMASMKKKNMWITMSTMFAFAIAAFVVNKVNYPDGYQSNYMFLSQGDGTPYDIFYNLVNGNKVLYPLIVVGLFVGYIVVFYAIFNAIANKKNKSPQKEIYNV